MKDIFVGPARPAEITDLHQWLTSADTFDIDLLQYKRGVEFFAARHEGKPLLFVPVQTVWFLDPLAARPGLTNLELASAVATLVKALVSHAQQQGVNEIYFIGRGWGKFPERHGCELMIRDHEKALYRLKVTKL